jgi:prepilin-type N-terminal cleavage/methylation domain-containing protein
MTRRGFTLLELLIVVAIIAILVAIAVPNFLEASERALRAADCANLKAIATGLQCYYIDYAKLPPADAEAGPYSSISSTKIKIAPADGGSLDGVPWILYERKYIGKWETLFCPKYLKIYSNGKALSGGDYPRYHNFRYAYNAATIATGLYNGGQGNIMNGTVWIARDLGLAADKGWWAGQAPNYPADYRFPWGAEQNVEAVLYGDMAVHFRTGGTDDPPPAGFPNN